MKIPVKPFLPHIVPAKIFLPVLLSMFLFIGTFFGYMLPKVETHLMDRKREMIHALSESAMSSIRYYAELAQNNVIGVEEAKHQAIALLRRPRYGPEGKDYFWINDTHPTMIMHPYRPDLEGKDVTDMIISDMIPAKQRNAFEAKITQLNNNQPDDYLLETTFILKNQRTIIVEATFAKLETAEHMSTFLMTAPGKEQPDHRRIFAGHLPARPEQKTKKSGATGLTPRHLL